MVVTFLPFPDVRKSLECLDNPRLKYQRVEALMIIRSIESGKLSNNPAFKMWADNLDFLKYYYNASLQIFEERGGNNAKCVPVIHLENPDMPAWFGYEPFHASHRAALYRKNPTYYSSIFDTVTDAPYLEYGYCWPTRYYPGCAFSDLFGPIPQSD